MRGALATPLKEQLWYEINVNHLFTTLAVLLLIMSVVFVMFMRVTGLTAKIVVMPISYIGFFTIRVLLFMILRRFSPTFTMKSVLSGPDLLLVGVNMKGHEVFTYVVH